MSDWKSYFYNMFNFKKNSAFFLKKKTREEQVEHHTKSIVSVLLNENEFSFSELELVQIMNDSRRIFYNELKRRKSDCISKSLEFQQKSESIQKAIDLIE